MVRRLLLGAVLLVSSAALAEETSSDAQKAEQRIVLLERLADIVTNDKGNCPKMAADVNKYIEENKALVAALEKWANTLSAEQKKKLEEKYKSRTETAVKKLQAGVNSCAKDKGVQAAFAKLKGG